MTTQAVDPRLSVIIKTETDNAFDKTIIETSSFYCEKMPISCVAIFVECIFNLFLNDEF